MEPDQLREGIRMPNWDMEGVCGSAEGRKPSRGKRGFEVMALEISRQLYLVGWDLPVSLIRSISSGGDGSLP